MPIPANHGYHRLRKGRTSRPQQIYLLTTVCAERQCWFDDTRIAGATMNVLQEKRLWRDSIPLCWVLMPDHFHLLLQLGDDESLPAFMNRLKSITSRTARALRDDSTAVWMAGYHDHALRSEEHVHDAVRYILENPMRAGLADSIETYPYRHCLWSPEAPRS
jgi:REP element-mobilizing transposase RayT